MFPLLRSKFSFTWAIESHICSWCVKSCRCFFLYTVGSRNVTTVEHVVNFIVKLISLLLQVDVVDVLICLKVLHKWFEYHLVTSVISIVNDKICRPIIQYFFVLEMNSHSWPSNSCASLHYFHATVELMSSKIFLVRVRLWMKSFSVGFQLFWVKFEPFSFQILTKLETERHRRGCTNCY